MIKCLLNGWHNLSSLKLKYRLLLQFKGRWVQVLNSNLTCCVNSRVRTERHQWCTVMTPVMKESNSLWCICVLLELKPRKQICFFCLVDPSPGSWECPHYVWRKNSSKDAKFARQVDVVSHILLSHFLSKCLAYSIIFIYLYTTSIWGLNSYQMRASSEIK